MIGLFLRRALPNTPPRRCGNIYSNHNITLPGVINIHHRTECLFVSSGPKRSSATHFETVSFCLRLVATEPCPLCALSAFDYVCFVLF